jgi:outer membrane protein assembly factor BamD (BamD/ComL family)
MATRLEREKSEIGIGLNLSEEYVRRFPAGQWLDEALFLRAQFLEDDSPFRDIEKARDAYSDLLTTHPESGFAEPARLRLRYIERHFFQVR